MLTLDARLFGWVVAHRVHALDSLMWILSVVGRGGIVWLILGMLLAGARRIAPQSLAQLALAIVLASVAADRVIKPAVQRVRPFQSNPTIQVIGGHPRDWSFPSGHSANAFAGATVLTHALPPAAVVWWALACAIAFSRVYLGVHYPLDVIGGAVVGMACGLVVVTFARRATPSGTPSHPEG